MSNYPFNIHFAFLSTSNFNSESEIVRLIYKNHNRFKEIEDIVSHYNIDLNQVTAIYEYLAKDLMATLNTGSITNSIKKQDAYGIIETIVWRSKTLRFLKRKRIINPLLIRKILFEKRQFLENLPLYIKQKNNSTQLECSIKNFEITIINGNCVIVINKKIQ